ncbi:MAG: amidohydrolase [Bacillota bacterium]
MSTSTELKRRVCEAIEANADRIIAIGETIWQNPELGFKEEKTARLVAEIFAELGLPHRTGIALTGVVGTMDSGRPGPNVAVMGELDSLNIPGAPHADPATGAAHSCGHNAQIAEMLGVAIGLHASGVMSELVGKVTFMAIPAEEYVEIEYRNGLRQQGKIEFLGGKQEFIRLGEFDQIDGAMMVHLANKVEGKPSVKVGGTSNGFLGKLVRFVGRPAHAAGAPEQGINALSAATLALTAINAQRETFRDDDHIRVHPIITRGGDLVNIIPADVRMETYVRGKTVPAIIDANRKVNRAIRAGAMAMDAEVEITEIPGYLPQLPCDPLADLFRANATALVGAEEVADGGHGAGSSDVGDVSHLLPTIQPFYGAVEGRFHGEDFQIVDKRMAYIEPTKAMAMTVVDLLADGGAKMNEIKAAFRPVYTRESYLKMWREVMSEA